MSAADRSRYEARQAQLVRSLMRGDGFPAGFPADKAEAAGRALRGKRARAAAKAWPALTHSLGARFSERFDAYARTTSAPIAGGGLADGLAFARRLNRSQLSEHARIELLLARRALARRGLFVGAVTRHHPRRLLVALRIPGTGSQQIVVPLAPQRR